MGNYKLKNIMLGIGIGLVFSSMINISIGGRELTVEEIKNEAAKHNLIVLSNEDIINNQTPKTDSTIAAAPTPTPTPTPAPTPTVKPVQITPSPSQTPPSAATITVSVKSGMSSETIANLLQEKGLIKDTKAFLKSLADAGKDDKLKIGSFDIPKGSGYADIIKILTQ
jgi:hypothetical protein